jgi:Uma2 family endonuclease
MEKIEDYLRNKVRLVWVVDFEQMSVTVYRSDRTFHLLKNEQELTAEDVLPGFRCRVSDFFFVPGGPRPGQDKPTQSGESQ